MTTTRDQDSTLEKIRRLSSGIDARYAKEPGSHFQLVQKMLDQGLYTRRQILHATKCLFEDHDQHSPGLLVASPPLEDMRLRLLARNRDRWQSYHNP